MDQKLLISALLEAHAQGHGPEVMAEVHSMANEPWHDEESGDPEAHERVKAQLLKRTMARIDRVKQAKKSLEGHRVGFDDSVFTKANDESKDYQGRQAGGQFGSGTSGKDSKEQELQDRDSGKEPSHQGDTKAGELHGIYKDHANLSYQEIHQKVSDHLSKLPKDQVVKEVRDFGISQPITSRKQAIELATRKITELKESVDRTAGIKNSAEQKPVTTKLGTEPKDHEIAPGGDPRFQNLSVEPSKMSMVHGKKDELTSGLGQHQVGKK